MMDVDVGQGDFWKPKPPDPYRRPRFRWSKHKPWTPNISEAYILSIPDRPFMHAVVGRLDLPRSPHHGGWIALVEDPEAKLLLNQGRCLSSEPRYYGPYPEGVEEKMCRVFRRRVEAKRTVQVYFGEKIEIRRQQPWSEALTFLGSMAIGLLGVYGSYK